MLSIVGDEELELRENRDAKKSAYMAKNNLNC